MFTYKRLVPGSEIGRDIISVTQQDLDGWTAMYGVADRGLGKVPAGLVAAIGMRAYLGIVTPRPAGNIHAKQSYRLWRCPRLEEEILVSVVCSGTESRKERLVVTMETLMSTVDGDRPIFSSVSTMFWAR
ncbi:putative MaoC_dehydrat_N domain-containing protein [Hyphomicrobiales bacterium]|nr:putative MaoC_dehydrat_N domain-containing protein [Hyphomicrobiales bacterium]CAH1692019.1 conserved hypothetical protein [Hyphomicrobiales bacterium]